MGANNQTQSNVKFYKLKEDERENSQTKGHLMFFEQVKTNDKWGDGAAFNSMEGNLSDVRLKSYEYQGDKKEVLEIELYDIDGKYVFSIGFRAIAAQNILNTLAGEAKLGTLKFSTGKPKEYNGKMYTTLYINNGGEKTKWKYSKATNNEPPKVTTIKDDDGNLIKRGQKALDDFWKSVLENEIKPKISDRTIIPDSQEVRDNDFYAHTPEPADDLPF